MISTAKLRYLRIAPRKVRLVADLIRGKTVERSQAILGFTRKKAALSFLKLLKQAVANAQGSFQVDEKNLYISTILVDEGPRQKKYFPRARGKADVLHKKTSHITIVLDEIKKKAKKKVSKPETERRRKRKAKTTEVEKKKEEKPKEEKPEKEIKTLIKKPRPRQKVERAKPGITKGLRRFFRRKAF